MCEAGEGTMWLLGSGGLWARGGSTAPNPPEVGGNVNVAVSDPIVQIRHQSLQFQSELAGITAEGRLSLLG